MPSPELVELVARALARDEVETRPHIIAAFDVATREGCAMFLRHPDGRIEIVERWWRIIVDSRDWTGRRRSAAE